MRYRIKNMTRTAVSTEAGRTIRLRARAISAAIIRPTDITGRLRDQIRSGVLALIEVHTLTSARHTTNPVKTRSQEDK